MEEQNIPEIGTEIICINDKPFPVNEIGPELKLDTTYTLKEIIICGCGQKHYNVGLPLLIGYVECYKCRERLPLTTHWCNSTRFK